MYKLSMPAKSHLEKRTGLAGHGENDGMIVDLTVPYLQVSPRDQVPHTTCVLRMQQEAP
jgi:hypothetical protein